MHNEIWINFADIAFYVLCGNQPTQQQVRSRRSAYAPADGSEGMLQMTGPFLVFQKVQVCVKNSKPFFSGSRWVRQ